MPKSLAQLNQEKQSLNNTIQTLLPGYESVTNASFFSRVVLGNPLTANGGVYQYFGQNGGQFNSTTNFPIAGQLPANMGFIAWGYRFEFSTAQDVSDVMTAFQDAYFTITVAEYRYKNGHGLELFKFYPGVVYEATAEIGATGIALVAPHPFASSEGAATPLREPIPLTSLVSVSAQLTLLTDVAGLHAAATKFRLIGTLARKIAG